MSAIYISKNGQQLGPYSVEQINEMLEQQQAVLTDDAWMEGMQGWEPINSGAFADLEIGQSAASDTAEVPTQPSQAPTQASSALVETAVPTGGGSFSIGDSLSEGFGFFKANARASILFVIIIIVVVGAIPFVGALLVPLIMINFMAGVKNYRNNGTPLDVGQLFDFSNVVHKIFGPLIVSILIGIGMIFLIVPGIILALMWAFFYCVLADRPGTSFTEAMTISAAVTKGNRFDIFLLMIAGCFVLVISAIPLGLGLLVTIPMTQAAIYCAYENCKGNS
jgi:uncharacterized membrane protein